MKHVVCYSGGHSSALVALNVMARFGSESLLLVNHDISPNVEHEDIKRFKKQVADYIGLPITFVNSKHLPKDQFDVCIDAKAFKVGNGNELCTSRLKTEPFMQWLNKEFPEKDCIIYYGFDINEKVRIQRRSSILGSLGYKTDYPLALWKDLNYTNTKDIGIEPPMGYTVWKHANCIGCLKAGTQHWYLTYLHRPDLFEKGMLAEDIIGYSIHKDYYLDEIKDRFELMKNLNIETTEYEDGRTFAARVRKIIKIHEEDQKPCECVF